MVAFGDAETGRPAAPVDRRGRKAASIVTSKDDENKTTDEDDFRRHRRRRERIRLGARLLYPTSFGLLVCWFARRTPS
jgi:hypothetical protein